MEEKENQVSENGFRKEIGLFGGISVIGGIVIGSGIFYLGSYVLQYVGMSEGLALLCWIIGGFLSLLGGLCYAELGAAFPKAGGNIYYLSEAFHPLIGSLDGYSLFLISDPASSAAISIALITALFGNTMSDMQIKIASIILIVALSIYNCFGVKLSNILQNISMAAKLIPLIIIIVLGLFMGNVQPDLSLAVKEATGGNTIGMIALGIMASLWAYEGWTNINLVSEEMKNPQKNLPRAIIISLTGITLLYTLFNFVIYRILPLDVITKELADGNLYLGTLATKNLLGNLGSILVTLCMVFAMFGSLNGCLWTPPRTYYALAQEKHWPKAFGKLNPKTGVPVFGFVIETIMAIIFVCFNTLQDLTILVAFTSLIFNSLTVLAVPVFRKKFPDVHRPYRVWTPIVYIYLAAEIILIAYTIATDMRNSFISLGALVIGVIIYYFFEWKLKKEKTKDVS
ncbi:APC family permease [Catenisphaera adipataccumulans]|jgi:APA family basic amino acid/polyamine antiporter|uniref:APA family basic amino acid/polyamine antiporter n=1 Tax=Catenisphaera adipataccumulans TaxID=700500 RepID=A0A7W8CXX9_9FIRM|nr:amino acid permease [Catenisphaera adipataccumulans]MBB5183657.1 APA family basic amino acid/polyamine antiporter [Catenisphaera adipataccumulans]